MVKNAIIKEFLEIIEKEIESLKKKQSVSLEQYLDDWDLQHIVERSFQKIIQACIDIGARLIAQKSWGKADDYHGIFDVLFKSRVFPLEFSEKMKKLVGFRNALVHEYRMIDDKEVYRHLQESLPILQEFTNHIVEFLQKEEGK